MTDVPAAIKQHLNVDVEFVRIHRNGFTKHGHDEPISITGRLVDRGKRTKFSKPRKLKTWTTYFYRSTSQLRNLYSSLKTADDYTIFPTTSGKMTS